MELIEKYIFELTTQIESLSTSVEKLVLMQMKEDLENTKREYESYILALPYLSCLDPHAYIKDMGYDELRMLSYHLRSRFLTRSESKLLCEGIVGDKIEEWWDMEIQKLLSEPTYLQQLTKEQLGGLRGTLEDREVVFQYVHDPRYHELYVSTILAMNERNKKDGKDVGNWW